MATNRDPSSESKLIEQVLHGNSQAYGLLVQAHQDRLYCTILHLVGCPHEAQDVTQEAFLKAFVGLPRFHQGSTFYTWLFRIALNVAYTRRRTRRNVSLDQTPVDSVETADGPQLSAERAETVEQVRHALDELPEEFRTILILREMEGFDYQTIAGILNIRVGTVRSRLHRARARMQQAWQDLSVTDSNA